MYKINKNNIIRKQCCLITDWLNRTNVERREKKAVSKARNATLDKNNFIKDLHEPLMEPTHEYGTYGNNGNQNFRTVLELYNGESTL